MPGHETQGVVSRVEICVTLSITSKQPEDVCHMPRRSGMLQRFGAQEFRVNPLSKARAWHPAQSTAERAPTAGILNQQAGSRFLQGIASVLALLDSALAFLAARVYSVWVHIRHTTCSRLRSGKCSTALTEMLFSLHFSSVLPGSAQTS